MFDPNESEYGENKAPEYKESEEKKIVDADFRDVADDERSGGEYHYTAPEIKQHESYSDAGFVSSDDASPVPPRFHCTVNSEPKAKEKKPREKKGVGMPSLIAACLVCAIIGGIGGGAVVSGYSGRKSGIEAVAQPTTVINMASPNTTNVSTNLVTSGSALSAQEIYELAKTRTVAIKSEITYTNIFGFSSSAAVSGSGFIISSNGYIMTNYHVIEDAVKGGYEITVLMNDGSSYTADVVGYEQDNDVAVLKIAAEGLDAVTIGDSDALSVGENVYAVGNPLGELDYTMTGGMVSALDRDISSTDSTTGVVTTINMFQIDAAINSGNSGGPVFNSRGEVIGMVTAKYSDTGVEGLGFAIPINDAINIANDLMTNGYVSGKAYMGISVQTVPSNVAQYYNMVEGAYVYSVEEGSCAERSGMRVGDIIVDLGGTSVFSRSDLISAKKGYKAGDTVTVRVYRSGEYVDLSITFDEEMPQTETASGSGEQTGTQQSGKGQYGAQQFGGSRGQ